MAETIVVDNLTKRFGAFFAVHDVSITVAAGEVLGFLGPNGAGKTTTMRMVAGFLEPTAGTARVAGFDIRREPIEAKRRIGYLPEGAPLYGDMTARSFLGFIAEMRGFRGAAKHQCVDRVVGTVSLEGVLDQPIDTLSKGYKRRVGLAQAILHDPPVLILDEPTDGLDPNQKHQVRGLIGAMAKEKAIIISTHILEEVEAVCTRAAIIARGRIVADDTAEGLLSRLPEHNAVDVTVDTASVDAARVVLAEMAGPGRMVSERPTADGGICLRMPPANGASPAVDVAQALALRQIAVRRIDVVRGRLDDVFRKLTSPKEAAHV